MNQISRPDPILYYSLKADCKIAYIAKRKRKKEILSFVAGLEVTEFKDNGNETIEKLMDKLTFAAA